MVVAPTGARVKSGVVGAAAWFELTRVLDGVVGAATWCTVETGLSILFIKKPGWLRGVSVGISSSHKMKGTCYNILFWHSLVTCPQISQSRCWGDLTLPMTMGLEAAAVYV